MAAASKTVATRTPLAAQLEIVDGSDYPVLADPESLSGMLELLQQNVGGALTLRDLPRLANPSGRETHFSMPNPLGGRPTPVESVTGLMVGWSYLRLLWPAGEPLGEAPPQCLSNDGVRPVYKGLYADGGSRAHLNQPVSVIRNGELVQERQCASCPAAQWGSSTKSQGSGRGQECVQRLVMLANPVDEPLPMVISAPPTSIKALRERFVLMTMRLQMHYSSLVYEWSLTSITKGGNTYPVVEVEVVGMLEGARRRTRDNDGLPEPGSPAMAAYTYSQQFGALLSASAFADSEASAAGHAPAAQTEDHPGGLGGDFENEEGFADHTSGA